MGQIDPSAWDALFLGGIAPNLHSRFPETRYLTARHHSGKAGPLAGYPHKPRDREGFFLSMGFIAALIAIGAIADFARNMDAVVGVIALVATVAAVVLYRRAQAHR